MCAWSHVLWLTLTNLNFYLAEPCGWCHVTHVYKILFSRNESMKSCLVTQVSTVNCVNKICIQALNANCIKKWWLIVVIDYFIKGIKVELLASIQVVRHSKLFVWKNIITQFGIIQFHLLFDNKFRKFYSLQHHERFLYPSPPQCNRQTEASNKTIIVGMKKTLEGVMGNWLTHKTTPRRSMGRLLLQLLMEWRQLST